MISEFSDEVPPPFNGKTDDFLKWERKYRLWKNITDVDKTKLGSLVLLNLDDDTQDTIFESIKLDELKKIDGDNQVIEKLRSMFVEEESITTWNMYEELNSFKRPGDYHNGNLTIIEHQNEENEIAGSSLESSNYVSDWKFQNCKGDQILYGIEQHPQKDSQ